MGNKIRITKKFTFETAHAIYGYDGLCENVHGHSYKLNVTVIGTPINNPDDVKNGMIIDFSDLKKIVRDEIVIPFDHATVLNYKSPHKLMADEMERRGNKIIKVDFQPTCEMLVIDFAEKIKKKLPSNIALYSLKLTETATAYAEWYESDN